MTSYRKKPVRIDAVQWDGTAEGAATIIDWASTSGGTIRFHNYPDNHLLAIDTLEGVMSASPGDWIIRGVVGEIYACKPNVFEATYERVGP